MWSSVFQKLPCCQQMDSCYNWLEISLNQFNSAGKNYTTEIGEDHRRTIIIEFVAAPLPIKMPHETVRMISTFLFYICECVCVCLLQLYSESIKCYKTWFDLVQFSSKTSINKKFLRMIIDFHSLRSILMHVLFICAYLYAFSSHVIRGNQSTIGN